MNESRGKYFKFRNVNQWVILFLQCFGERRQSLLEFNFVHCSVTKFPNTKNRVAFIIVVSSVFKNTQSFLFSQIWITTKQVFSIHVESCWVIMACTIQLSEIQMPDFVPFFTFIDCKKKRVLLINDAINFVSFSVGLLHYLQVH